MVNFTKRGVALALIGAGAIALLYWQKEELPPVVSNVLKIPNKIVDRIVATTTRGFRNNNPLNIKEGQTWQGESPVNVDATFEEFTAPEYGFRAAARILDTYKRKYGIATIQGVIARWAPSEENPTGQYITYVAGQMKVAPSTPLDLSRADVMADLLTAMTRFENSRLFPYTRETLLSGIHMARV